MKQKIIIAVILLTTFTTAQQAHELTPGVKGNQLILQLANISPTQSVDNVEVKLIRGSTNISFESSEVSIKNVNISEEKEAAFNFDINYNIEITKADTVEFLITDNQTIRLKKQFIFTYTQPKEFSLEQNYPNPFNPTTKIRYTVPLDVKEPAPNLFRGEMSNVVLKVFDILGNEVATLVNEAKPAGYYEVEFDANNLSSGVYIYRIAAGKFISTRKMMVVK